ncbi:MAG TPA: PspC domain-containing protein, partial [Microthrixaceae bacterium]|nr:PspC domain-containing protein [Microthrixaceae bacterium]
MTTAVHPDQDTAGDQMERSAEFEPRPMILGIATALAQRYGVSVAVVRAAFTTLAVAGGVGIALYLLIALGWKHRSSIVQPPSGSRDLGAILLTIGVVWQLGSIWQGVNPTLVLPVGLVALGVALGWRSGPPGAFD